MQREVEGDGKEGEERVDGGRGREEKQSVVTPGQQVRDDFTSEAQGGYVVHRTCTYVYTTCAMPPHTHNTISVLTMATDGLTSTIQGLTECEKQPL